MNNTLKLTETGTDRITELEEKMLVAMPDDTFYQEDMDNRMWIDYFIDELDMDNKKARGVFASLVRKEMIDSNGESFELTTKGINFLTLKGIKL